MNDWNPEDALEMMIQASLSRSTSIGSTASFAGDRYHLAPLANAIISDGVSCISQASRDVLNIKRRFVRHSKSYNREKWDAKDVLSLINGTYQLKATSTAVIGKLIRSGDDFFLRIHRTISDYLELKIDSGNFMDLCDSWSCTVDDFSRANIVNSLKNRTYTIHYDDTGFFLKNFCVPIHQGNDESEKELIVRVRNANFQRNLYNVLERENFMNGLFRIISIRIGPEKDSDMDREGNVALLMQDYYLKSNESKSTCLNKLSPHAPIIRIHERIQEISADSADNSLKAFLEWQMEDACKVNSFCQHSFLSLKQLIGVLKYAVNVADQVEGNNLEINAINKFTDRFEVSFSIT